MGSQNDSCEEIPWQASFPILLHNLADKWTKSADTSFRSCQQAPKKLTTEAIFVICVILIFVILNIIGSSINAYESYRKAALLRKKTFRKVKDEDANEDENVANANGDTLTEKKVKANESSTISVWRENGRAFFDCFCIQTNARKIFSFVSKQEHLDYIDGIRAIFFLYIFLSHFLYFYSRSIKNLDKHLQAVLDMPITWYAANSAFGVDAFLTLSGFLNGFSFSNYFKKNNGKISWVAFYTLRIIRLTPLYMILLGFYTTLFTYMSSSPIWPTYDTNPVCKETWIWNLLYLNNFNSYYNQCMAYSWFLACIMQLYMISPLFMIPLNRWPRIGYGLSAAAICVSCFSAFIITKQNNLFGCIPTLSESDGLEEINRQLWQVLDELHQKTYTRLTSYLIGILLGCYLCNRKFTKKNSLLTLSFGWLISAILIWITCFTFCNGERSAWEIAIFNGVKYLLNSCSFSWLLFVCSTGQAGLIGAFLSHPIFKPLSRLSYCGLLAQTIVLEGYFLSVEVFIDETAIYEGALSDLSWATLLLRLLFWTLVTAFMASLLFESPIIRLLHLYSTAMKAASPEKESPQTSILPKKGTISI